MLPQLLSLGRSGIVRQNVWLYISHHFDVVSRKEDLILCPQKPLTIVCGQCFSNLCSSASHISGPGGIQKRTSHAMRSLRQTLGGRSEFMAAMRLGFNGRLTVAIGRESGV